MPHTNVGPSIQRYLCFKYTALLQVLIGHYASSFNRFFLSSDTVVGADELNNRSCDNGCKVLLRQSKGCENAFSALYFKKHENLKQTKTNLSRGKKNVSNGFSAK